jgi:mRNA-degrading endonuclease RelE of RelBE toxin-antitoxin system
VFTLFTTPNFDRAYSKVTPQVRKQAERQILRLQRNPRHPSLDHKKMLSRPGIWGARINRDYRILFLMEGEVITLLSIHPHEK